MEKDFIDLINNDNEMLERKPLEIAAKKSVNSF